MVLRLTVPGIVVEGTKTVKRPESVTLRGRPLPSIRLSLRLHVRAKGGRRGRPGNVRLTREVTTGNRTSEEICRGVRTHTKEENGGSPDRTIIEGR